MNVIRSLGPGLLYAGAAIGVSHIVQSTKAGAMYGPILIIGVLVAHLFKYPFFALGPRYAERTGQNLIQGFASLNRSWLHLLLAMTVLTMFAIQAAVTVVTAGLFHKMTGLEWPIWAISGLLLAVCMLILLIGEFRLLEQLMKVIMVILALSTIAAMALSFGVEQPTSASVTRVFSIRNPVDLAFLIAFLGWMPAPLDIAIWHSIWSVSKKKEGGNSALDFKIGFYGTAFLAICFLVLGANSLYGTGIALEPRASDFAAQLVDLYTNSLGAWSYPIIIIAAFTTMFSTTLTCFDALPKVMAGIARSYDHPDAPLALRVPWMFILAIGSTIILAFFVRNMGQMVTMATIVSFLVAPVLAWMSIALVRRSPHALWHKNEMRLAWIGLLFLALFSLVYLFQLCY